MSIGLKAGYRTVDGLQIRYADSDGPAIQHLVPTSPWPESLHAFDRMWPRLPGRILDERNLHDPHLACPGIGTPAALFAAASQPARAEPEPGRRRQLPEQLPRLAGLLPRIFTPMQIIAGRWDPSVPVANAEFLRTRLPDSRLDVLDAGHLAWEEASGEYGAIIAAWVNGGYLVGSKGMTG